MKVEVVFVVRRRFFVVTFRLSRCRRRRRDILSFFFYFVVVVVVVVVIVIIIIIIIVIDGVLREIKFSLLVFFFLPFKDLYYSHLIFYNFSKLKHGFNNGLLIRHYYHYIKG